MQDLEGRKECIAAGLKGIFVVIYSLHFIHRRMEVQRGYGTCQRSPSELASGQTGAPV